ncbi:MAG: hybrid sensor histidine kinase/response regulator, partial [Pseudomonadota bacterium]
MVASILLGVMGVLAPEPLIQMGLLAAATTLFLLGIALSVVIRRDRAAQDRTLQAVAGFIEKDSAPSFVCTADGEVLSANAAARTRYATRRGETLVGTLR